MDKHLKKTYIWDGIRSKVEGTGLGISNKDLFIYFEAWTEHSPHTSKVYILPLSYIYTIYPFKHLSQEPES